MKKSDKKMQVHAAKILNTQEGSLYTHMWAWNYASRLFFQLTFPNILLIITIITFLNKILTFFYDDFNYIELNVLGSTYIFRRFMSSISK